MIAGSSGGTLKLRRGGKVARTLTGHRSNCVGVVAPVRRVLRRAGRHQPQDLGHPPALVHPDVPRPLARGAPDPLLARRPLGERRRRPRQGVGPDDRPPRPRVRPARGAIAALAIHPAEFLLASASTDRTMRLWDLETFQPVCQAGDRRCCAVFSDDGRALIGGADEALKVGLGARPLPRRRRNQVGEARRHDHRARRQDRRRLDARRARRAGPRPRASPSATTRRRLSSRRPPAPAAAPPRRACPAAPPSWRRRRPTAPLRPPPTANTVDNTIRQHIGACRSKPRAARVQIAAPRRGRRPVHWRRWRHADGGPPVVGLHPFDRWADAAAEPAPSPPRAAAPPTPPSPQAAVVEEEPGLASALEEMSVSGRRNRSRQCGDSPNTPSRRRAASLARSCARPAELLRPSTAPSPGPTRALRRRGAAPRSPPRGTACRRPPLRRPPPRRRPPPPPAAPAPGGARGADAPIGLNPATLQKQRSAGAAAAPPPPPRA